MRLALGILIALAVAAGWTAWFRATRWSQSVQQSCDEDADNDGSDVRVWSCWAAGRPTDHASPNTQD